MTPQSEDSLQLPLMSFSQMQNILTIVQHIFDLRPILKSKNPGEALERVLTPLEITKAYVDGPTLNKKIRGLIRNLEEESDLFQLAINQNENVRKVLKAQLYTILKSNALMFQRTDNVRGPEPQPNDIVMFVDSGKSKRFGRITRVESNQTAIVEFMYYGKLSERAFHRKNIKLLYRPPADTPLKWLHEDGE